MEKKQGVLTRYYAEDLYYSERGFPLITQYIEDDENVRGMLTVENYVKWYRMYIIRPDGTVEGRVNTACDHGEDKSWIDHAVIPYAFHETARNLGLVYDDITFAMVCERFVSDVLDGDWTKLAPFLPTAIEPDSCPVCGSKRFEKQHRPECPHYGHYDNFMGQKYDLIEKGTK